MLVMWRKRPLCNCEMYHRRKSEIIKWHQKEGCVVKESCIGIRAIKALVIASLQKSEEMKHIRNHRRSKEINGIHKKTFERCPDPCKHHGSRLRW